MHFVATATLQSSFTSESFRMVRDYSAELSKGLLTNTPVMSIDFKLFFYIPPFQRNALSFDELLREQSLTGRSRDR